MPEGLEFGQFIGPDQHRGLEQVAYRETRKIVESLVQNPHIGIGAVGHRVEIAVEDRVPVLAKGEDLFIDPVLESLRSQSEGELLVIHDNMVGIGKRNPGPGHIGIHIVDDVGAQPHPSFGTAKHHVVFSHRVVHDLVGTLEQPRLPGSRIGLWCILEAQPLLPRRGTEGGIPVVSSHGRVDQEGILYVLGVQGQLLGSQVNRPGQQHQKPYIV